MIEGDSFQCRVILIGNEVGTGQVMGAGVLVVGWIPGGAHVKLALHVCAILRAIIYPLCMHI